MKVTIAMTYFRSLTLKNLEAALYSVKRQDMSRVESILVFDNNTEDSVRAIQNVIDEKRFEVPTTFYSSKHGDSTRTHSWSTNTAMQLTAAPWVFFTRADFLLEPTALAEYVQVLEEKDEDWRGFVTSYGRHLGVDLDFVETTAWRTADFPMFIGTDITYPLIDTGVWLTSRLTFTSIGGLDERLTAWGHAQTDFQYRLYMADVEMVCVPKMLYHHPGHGGARDLDLAHQQLREVGKDFHKMWERHYR